ncbi:hypothetical protein MMC11_002303 [Xylographa trunciseda]|nr:hypothetical protein [Xylographa trunciseda]
MRPFMPNLKHTILEVERKFVCNPLTTSVIHANIGLPQLPNLTFKGRRTFEDIYYDLNEVCSSQGVYIRKRNGTWQAKVRQGGDFTNSQFSEFDEVEGIEALVEKLYSSSNQRNTLQQYVNASIKAENFGLGELARFVTRRDAWQVDDVFEVVVDNTDFGHSVGEVELQQVLEMGKKDDGGTAVRMDAQIKEFMLKHSWAFPSGKVVGKLSAYFEWARANKTG